MTLAHIVEVVRQGIWASLTGGWFYDPRQSHFNNIIHMYLWIMLLCLPLVIQLFGPFNNALIALYAAVIFVLFLGIKLMVRYLHHVFDTHQCLEEEPPKSAAGRRGIKETEEAIELPTIRNTSESSQTGPLTVGAPSNSSRPMRSVSVTFIPTPRPSPKSETTEDSNEDYGQRSQKRSEESVHKSESRIDFKADVHHHGSSDGSEDSTEKALLGRSPLSEKTNINSKKATSESKIQPNAEGENESQTPSDSQTRSVPSLAHRYRLGRSHSSGLEGPSRTFPALALRSRPGDSSTILSKETLAEARRQTRKSFPGRGDSSVDIFLERLPRTGSPYLDHSEFSVQHGDSENNVVAAPVDQLPSLSVVKRHRSLPMSPVKMHAKVGRFSSLEMASFPEIPEPESPDSNGRKAKKVEAELLPERETSQEPPECMFSSIKSGDSSKMASSFHTAESADVATNPGSMNSAINSVGSASIPIRDPPVPSGSRRQSLIRNLRQKLETLKSESNATLAEEHAEILPPKTPSTPNLSWLFTDTEELTNETVENTEESSSNKLRYSNSIECDDEPGPSSRPGLRSIREHNEDAADRQQPQTELKEELRRLIEEIIATHPDLIETLEQFRMRPDAGGDQREDRPRRRRRNASNNAVRNGRPRQRSRGWQSHPRQPAVPVPLAEMLSRPGAHFAASHEDTSPGSIHYFEDEDGTFWIYNFDERGGMGTAQSLGSSKAILEILAAGDIELFGSSSSMKAPSDVATVGDVSSSESEEDPYMAEVPTSVIHPGSATTQFDSMSIFLLYFPLFPQNFALFKFFKIDFCRLIQ